MSAADTFTIQQRRVPGEQLMERAGEAALQEITDRREEILKLCVIAGRGNNGGDGFVVARRALEAGIPVETVVLCDLASIKGEARVAFEKFVAAGGPVVSPADWKEVDEWKDAIGQSDVIVDALYGLRFRGALSDLESDVAHYVNESRRVRGVYVVALDLPSGALCDTGASEGTAFECDLTVSFQAWKPVHFCAPGAVFCGERVLVDIGIDLEKPAGAYLITPLELQELGLGSALVSSVDHKGSRGHLMIAAGGAGHSGAAALSARGGLRAGAGLVTLFSDPQSCGVAVMTTPEVMTHAIDELALPVAARDAIDRLLKTRLANGRGAFVIGPGLEEGPDLCRFMIERAKGFNLPTVIDAAALKVVGEEGVALPDQTILTPHPGEMAGLLKWKTAEVQADRFAAVRKAASQFGCCVVLKGAHTLIGFPEGAVFVSPFAHANLGTAGSGDVLSGILGGLLARGVSPEVAVVFGVFVHAQIGSQIYPQGLVGSLASEFAELFPDAVAELLSADEPMDANALPAIL